MAGRLHQSGNVFFALMGAIAVVGVLSYGVNTYIRGPLKTAVRITKQDAAEGQMNIAGQVAIMSAVSAGAGGDCDSDGYTEPLEWRDAGSLPKPTGGGLVPSSIGINKVDPWGTQYGYCAWDHGPLILNAGCQTTTPGTNMRLEGTNALTYPVVAIISAGPDRVFTTTCRNFSTGSDRADQNNNGVLTDAGDRELVGKASPTDDDIIITYTYDSAMAVSGGLWQLKSSDNTTAYINKNIQALDGSFGGTARFSSLTTNASNYMNVVSGLKLADAASVTTCNSGNKGVMRLNASASSIDICNGSSWVAAFTSSAPTTNPDFVDCAGFGSQYYDDTSTGHCYYKSSSTASNFAAAEAACAVNGGYLASITSAAEMALIRAHISESDTLYIGGNDKAAEGIWVYSGGESKDVQFWSGDSTGSVVGGQYNNWYTGEPNGSTGENCLAIFKSGYSNASQTWVDYPCTGMPEKYLCEIDPTTTGSSGLGINELTDGITNYTLGNVFVGDQTGNETVSGSRNTALGATSLQALTSGNDNSALGPGLVAVTSSSDNTSVGLGVFASQTGSNNTGVGEWIEGDTSTAGISYSTGVGVRALGSSNASNVTAIGPYAMYGSGAATGANLVGIGSGALSSFSTGAGNTAIGNLALGSTTTGSSNTAIGTEVARYNTTGSNNTATGYQSMYGNGGSNLGSNNTALGNNSLYKNNSSGTNNTGIGNYSLYANQSGTGNTGLGIYAIGNATGTGSTGIGYDVMNNMTAGTGNTAIGSYAMNDMSSSDNNNTAIGFDALGSLTTSAASNTAIGHDALQNSTVGTNNTAIIGLISLAGVTAAKQSDNISVGGLWSLTSGIGNVSIGWSAISGPQNASANVAIGGGAILANSAGSTATSLNTAIGYGTLAALKANGNTAVGYIAGKSVTTGTYNTAVGSNAMPTTTTGASNTAIGYGAGVTSATVANSTAIGNGALPTAANTIYVGNTSVTAITAQVAYAFPSDRRLKKDIEPSDLGLDFLMSLKPVSYRLKDGNGRLDYGFIAQDIEESLKGRVTNMITHDGDKNQTYILRSFDLTAPLVKSIQQQDETIRKLQARVAELKARAKPCKPEGSR